MTQGIYEELITQLVAKKIDGLNTNNFFINTVKIDKEEATLFLTQHLSRVIKNALGQIKGENQVEQQIRVANGIILFLKEKLNDCVLDDDLIKSEGEILRAIFSKVETQFLDLNLRLKEVMPSSRLIHSELFTGGNGTLSLESELKREIKSSDRIDLLVSFIKFKAVRILKDAFIDFTSRGGKLRIITTTYMGASDAKAIEELNKLPNTEIKVSYNNSNERLHAKAYLFFRNSGFHTGYIGSSNFSRSALTDGLEWNVKVTTREIPHIIDKFQKTFESYWNNSEFELFDASKLIRLSNALNQSRFGRNNNEFINFFDLTPYHYQSEVLEKLKVERTVHNSFKNLIVAATGTGKTMISAFDFKNHLLKFPNTKLLFIAHRIEILKQAQNTFRNVLKNQNFGELMGDKYIPVDKNVLFATIQTLTNQDLNTFCDPKFYDFIILDEVHHSSANTYQKIIQYFQPKVLLGLTATPERMDGKTILPDFNFRIAAEIRLPDALNNKLLCPFQYFGISDSIDYSKISWKNGKYDTAELTKVLTANDLRVGEIIHNIDRYSKDINDITALGFCVSIEHAKFMYSKFKSAGLKSSYLVSENSSDRVFLVNQLRNKEINYLFVVDIFNEGIDIPEIDTVLFLRPTESLTIFLQQLGRGLRLHENKDVLTVLDFVGQARKEYDFENKFRGLIGKTTTSIKHEIERDFPNLPLGCSIVLEKQAKEFILENIRQATSMNKQKLIYLLQIYQNQTDLPLDLKNFLKFYNLNLKDIYKNHTFHSLLSEAFKKPTDLKNYELYKSMLSKKWYVTESYHYFKFLLELIDVDFDLNKLKRTEENDLLALMLHYDFYQKASKGETLEKSIKSIGENHSMVEEMKQFLEVKIDSINFEEMLCTDLTYDFPLRIHARYTREQILVALRLSTLSKQSSNREGVAENKRLNIEALFVNLKKTEEDFSPTTMYDDFAINDQLFHWQSQNSTTPISEKGKSYIDHERLNKSILMFVRESKNDSNGFTQSYVFIGQAKFVTYRGSKPMSITWQLNEPLPNYLWNDAAKLQIG